MWWKLTAIAILAMPLIAFFFVPLHTHAVAYGPIMEASLPAIQSQMQSDQSGLRLWFYAGYADIAALLLLGWLAWRVVRNHRRSSAT